MDYNGYDYPRGGGRGNERIIPISFGDGRQPSRPEYPNYPPHAPASPTRPDRQPDFRNPGNSRIIPQPAQPAGPVKQIQSDFSEHELDEMDAVAAILKRKRAAEGHNDNNSSDGRLKSVSNTNYNAETNDGQNQPEHGNTNPISQNPSACYPPKNLNNAATIYPGSNPSQQIGIGFVMPTPGGRSSLPLSQNSQSLPYPTNPNQFGGVPGFPMPPMPGNQYPGYSSQQNIYPQQPGGFQQNYYPPPSNPYQ